MLKGLNQFRGREWVSPQGGKKYFNSIQGWRIEKLAAEVQAPSPMPAAQACSQQT
jgi:hypothetical protein